MIRTSTQLKVKVRNLSAGDNDRAKLLIRNFIMERFLERVALSRYRNNFILKGGMLVAAVVGLEARATMDIDTTVKSLPLTMEDARKVLEDVIQVEVPDGICFRITKATDIMEGHDYPGIRFMLDATLDKLRQALRLTSQQGMLSHLGRLSTPISSCSRIDQFRFGLTIWKHYSEKSLKPLWHGKQQTPA